MNSTPGKWLATALLVCISATGLAEEGEHGSSHGSGHHAHKNMVAGFIGITGEDRRERALTLGVDYTRWLTPNLGVGVGAEYALGDLDFLVVAVPLSYRTGAWKFFVGPGFEDSEHHSGNEFLVRAGVEYAFQKPDYEISPKFMLDFVDGDVVVVGGVAIGLGF